MNRKELVEKLYALMHENNYKRNNYNGITAPVYNKTYKLERKGMKTYSITLVFDYRKIDKEEVIIHAYDNNNRKYMRGEDVPKIREFITLLSKMMDMGLEVNLQEYEQK